MTYNNVTSHYKFITLKIINPIQIEYYYEWALKSTLRNKFLNPDNGVFIYYKSNVKILRQKFNTNGKNKPTTAAYISRVRIVLRVFKQNLRNGPKTSKQSARDSD